MPRQLKKAIHVETLMMMARDVFGALKNIIRGDKFRVLTNARPSLIAPYDWNSPCSTKSLTVEAVKMHEVMERSIDVARVTGIKYA